MAKKNVIPAEFLHWLRAQPEGAIMRPSTFAGIVEREFAKLRAEGVQEDAALKRARAAAGSAYWRAGVKKYVLATHTPPGKGATDGKVRRKRKTRRRSNPVLAVMGNPGEGSIFSRDVHSIAYTHSDDDQDYIHEFAGGVHMRANGDGSITIYHPNKSIWRNHR